MIGIGIANSIGYNRGGQGYSAEYQAVLDRATALGYTQPSSAQKTKQNALIQSLKDAGIWDLLDVFYVFATDGSSDFATLNWKSPSQFKCTKVNTPTFTANQGFTGNGSTQYLNTGWVPATNGVNYTLNSASICLHENTNVASNGIAAGVLSNSGTRYTTILPKNASNNSVYAVNSNGNSTSVSQGATTSIGFYLANRISTANANLFKNGVKIGVDTALTAGTERPALAMYLLARNNFGSADSYRASQISCFGAGSNLESVQSDLYTAWNTYFTSL